MDSKLTLIEKILNHEWDMFSNLENLTGEKSPCQKDPETFNVMRTSQFASYSKNILKSYLNDLTEAISQNRNLLAEKYAWMMKTTMPIEFARIEHLLPQPNSEALHIINKIAIIELEWHKELMEEYPFIIQRGRPLYSSQDNQHVTSVETYLKGELMTYSLKTLEIYYKNRLKQKDDNINGIKKIFLCTAKLHGYETLVEFNKALKPDQMNSG